MTCEEHGVYTHDRTLDGGCATCARQQLDNTATLT